MIAENLENNEDIVCCIKCRRGFKKIRSFHSHYMWENPEVRKKISSKSTELFKSAEFRKKRSGQVKADWNNPERKKNFEKGLINGRLKLAKLRGDEDCRKEIGIKTKQNWKNSEYRKKVTDATKLRWQNPEYKEKISNALKKTYTEEEYKNKVNAYNKKRREKWKHEKELKSEEMSEYLKYNDLACCVKCRKGFKKIHGIRGHYSMAHVFKNNENIIEKRKQTQSAVSKDRWKNPEYRNKMSKMSKEKWKSVEHRNKMTKIMKEALKNPELRKKFSENTKKLWQNPKHKEAMRAKLKITTTANWQNPEFRNKAVEATRKNWKNPEYVKRIMKGFSIKPNKSEQSLEQILNDLYPSEWKFVGDGEVVIGGFCPDFINCNGKKLIVEFDGDYWHSSEKVKEKDRRKLAKYKELGFDTLVIKENEFKNDKEGTKNRIVEFVKNYEKEHYSLLV